jgi:hypothetical protein
VHIAGPVGVGVDVGVTLTDLDGVREADDDTGADEGSGVELGVDDVGAALVDATAETDGELTGGVVVTPPDEVQATAPTVTAARAAASSARVNCRSAGRSSRAGS